MTDDPRAPRDADDAPVDLSPLDPAREAARWQAAVEEVVARAVVARAARAAKARSTASVLAALAPFAAAAAVALVATASLLARSRRAHEGAANDPVAVFLAPGSGARRASALAELAIRREP